LEVKNVVFVNEFYHFSAIIFLFFNISKSEIGLKSFIDFGVVVLGISVTAGILKFLGKTFLVMHLLNNCSRKGANNYFNILINLVVTSSSPGAERNLRLLIQILTSSTVISYNTKL